MEKGVGRKRQDYVLCIDRDGVHLPLSASSVCIDRSKKSFPNPHFPPSRTFIFLRTRRNKARTASARSSSVSTIAQLQIKY